MLVKTQNYFILCFFYAILFITPLHNSKIKTKIPQRACTEEAHGLFKVSENNLKKSCLPLSSAKEALTAQES